MTSNEKKQADMLRDQRLTYVQIAEKMGLGVSTVKMYFQRKTPSDHIGICPQCKKPLGKDAPSKKRFCSDKCRVKWWIEHPEQLSNQQQHLHRCPVCGKGFYSFKPAKFCSPSCYHRSRRKVGDANG